MFTLTLSRTSVFIVTPYECGAKHSPDHSFWTRPFILSPGNKHNHVFYLATWGDTDSKVESSNQNAFKLYLKVYPSIPTPVTLKIKRWLLAAILSTP